MMNEAVTKRFLLYFRLMLLGWILIANAIIHVTGLEYSWLIFLSNIMMFTLEGDVKDRFVTVELGGLVGLILTNGKGGPDRTSTTMIMYLNNHLFSKNYGMAGAVSVVLFLVCAVLCVVVYFSLTREDDGLTKAQRRELKAARKAAAKGGK